MRVEAVLGPAEIARMRSADLSDAVCVVFDVLRATTSLVTGLAHGMRGAIPVETIEEALAERARDPELLLGGERHGDRIGGFDLGNGPSEYTAVAGRRVVTTTTNGTVALRACEGARAVHAAALVNLAAAAEAVRAEGCGRVVLVCAGTFDAPALEDIYAAGALAERLGDGDLDDAAAVCRAVYRESGSDPGALLRRAANGRRLVESGREADLEWAARVSCCEVAARMAGRELVRIGG